MAETEAKVLVGSIVAGENAQLDDSAVTIVVSKKRARKFSGILQPPEKNLYGNYGVYVGEDEAAMLAYARQEMLLWQSEIIDHNLRGILTPGQYERFSIANGLGRTVKFTAYKRRPRQANPQASSV